VSLTGNSAVAQEKATSATENHIAIPQANLSEIKQIHDFIKDIA